MTTKEEITDGSSEPQEKQRATTDHKKKENSYYYWHGHEKDRAKAGDVAPMPKPVLVKKDENDTVSMTLPQPITKYSWSDSKKSVTVYIDTKIDNNTSMMDDTLCVEFKKKHLILSYSALTEPAKAQRKKQLTLSLYKAIVPAESSYKVKAPDGQIAVRLAKRNAVPWYDLVDKEKGSAADEDSDEEEKEEPAKESH